MRPLDCLLVVLVLLPSAGKTPVEVTSLGFTEQLPGVHVFTSMKVKQEVTEQAQKSVCLLSVCVIFLILNVKDFKAKFAKTKQNCQIFRTISFMLKSHEKRENKENKMSFSCSETQ